MIRAFSLAFCVLLATSPMALSQSLGLAAGFVELGQTEPEHGAARQSGRILMDFTISAHHGIEASAALEETPLGTAGALSLLKPPFSSPLVVMNADLVVSARIGQLVDYHLTEKAIITVGAKIVETMVPFGVLGTKGHTIQVIEEKPTHKDLINAGVYVLNAEVVEQLEPSAPADMPELIAANVDSGSVLAFPLHEDWLDLGRPDDLRRARANTQED